MQENLYDMSASASCPWLPIYVHTVREGHGRLCKERDGDVEDMQFAFVLTKS